ncbi:MAG: HAD-IIIA family hydrolase, partial [Chitinophagaceae bacterium]|nr:HAD-IIIA family hydrolase [Chitinophagaceae bacterium]
TLFLDRDGVINLEKKDDYIKNKTEFIFYPNTIDTLVKCSFLFSKIIIVTNQRGIGRDLMTEKDLDEIHQYMKTEIENQGGRIDAIYFAPDKDSNSPMRKPNTGMGLKAKKDFPEIDFSKSIMVGNNESDLKFGKALGMKTIFLTTTQHHLPVNKNLFDNHNSALEFILNDIIS